MRLIAWVVGFLGVVVLCWPAALPAQDRLPISAVELPFKGQGASLYLHFNVGQETRRIPLRSAFEIGAEHRLVIGTDPEHPERLPLHLLRKTAPHGEAIWQGEWSARLTVPSVPEYWAIDPVLAEMRNDSLLLICSLSTEECVGLYVAWCTPNANLMERFVPVSALDVELGMTVAPTIQPTWLKDGIGLQFKDAVLRLDQGQTSSAFPGDWLQMAVKPGGLEFAVRPQPAFQLSFGRYSYYNVIDRLVLLEQGQQVIKPKQLAKAAEEIARNLKLDSFDLVHGQAGVTAFFLRDSDGATYGPIWNQHWLGRWEAGKWTPAPQPR